MLNTRALRRPEVGDYNNGLRSLNADFKEPRDKIPSIAASARDHLRTKTGLLRNLLHVSAQASSSEQSRS
jgi:hypothetical protein